MELKNVIFHSVLKARGFTDVVNTSGEVAGNRGGGRVSVLHLGTSERSFWRVVVCACDGGFDPAKAAVDEEFTAIDQLKFQVRVVVHVGDIKSGSTTCSDERFASVRRAFDTFEAPVVYTPGDNEWTDCHRLNNGAYDPLERLATLRSLFFSAPGAALGRHPMRVVSQAALVEDVRWIESRVAFATLHVIGSNNGLAPWTGLGHAAPTPLQAAEVDARIGAVLAWVDATFDVAEAGGLKGVVLAMQADTWSPTPAGAQRAIVSRIAKRTAAFDGQVLLLQGDSHQFVADDPLGLPNFTRIVVHGETLPFEYLRLTVDPRSAQLFIWERTQVHPP